MLVDELLTLIVLSTLSFTSPIHNGSFKLTASFRTTY